MGNTLSRPRAPPVNAKVRTAVGPVVSGAIETRRPRTPISNKKLACPKIATPASTANARPRTESGACDRPSKSVPAPARTYAPKGAPSPSACASAVAGTKLKR